MFLFDFFTQVEEFGLRAGDEGRVEAFCCELKGVFFAYTVGGAGYERPRAFFAEFLELEKDG